MQKEEIKFQNSSVFEGMTSIRAILRGNDNGVNSRKIDYILYDQSKYNKIYKELGYLMAVSGQYGFEVKPTTGEYLNEITLGNSHGGLIAVAKDREIPSYTTLFENGNLKSDGFYCIMSVWNIQNYRDPQYRLLYNKIRRI